MFLGDRSKIVEGLPIMNNCENQKLEYKSLSLFKCRNPDWQEFAKDCVCFANAQGGNILIGIEDDTGRPPMGQTVPANLAEKIGKRIGELTINVRLVTELRVGDNGAEYIALTISRSLSPASTTDGRYYIRIADECKPLVGDEIQRLLNERGSQPWETLTSLHVPEDRFDQDKYSVFVAAIRSSPRVKQTVKEKDDQELLAHYLLIHDGLLTNLGVLCIGLQADRARLGTAPVIQFIKYDERNQKVNKLVWDDYSLSPMEMIESVWNSIPDFREQYELPHGLLRTTLPVYDEVVVRELLVNALVHRPYTQRGDIFLNLTPDRLEVVNPGLLPLGVTPKNILHVTVRRNEHLARIFHDLQLMEREGSGFDRMYEVLLSQGRPLPVLLEESDRVVVAVRKVVLKPEIIDFITRADQAFQLTQRERITLGLLAQHDSLTARQLAAYLELDLPKNLSSWMGRLVGWALVGKKGRTQSTRYFVDPDIIRRLDFSRATTLSRIEPHRLQALLLEDLKRYPGSSISDIHSRTAPEIDRKRIKRTLDFLISEGKVLPQGEKRWRRYSLT